MARRKGISAWLVTWEHTSYPDRTRIAVVLDPRWPHEKVAKYVEFLYIASLPLDDQISCVRTRGKNWAYGAQISPGRIQCGHNPFLDARLVNNLHLVTNEKGETIPSWEVRPLPPQNAKEWERFHAKQE